jgi:hypothetical protein
MTEPEQQAPAALVENMLLLRKRGLRRSARPCRRTRSRALPRPSRPGKRHAAKDIRELRDLLEAWRDARRTAWQTTVKVVTTGILAALLVGAAIKLKLMGGAQ